MMTKWDTIQADVADGYKGLDELLAWEEQYNEDSEMLKYIEEDEEEEIFDMFGDK
jgi:hypothetical protein